MGLKRKSATTVQSQPKSKVSKVKQGDKSSSKALKPEKARKVRQAESSSEEEEFEGFESENDGFDEESGSEEEDQSMEGEEDEEEGEDESIEEDDDEMQLDEENSTNQNGTAKPKEVPVHAAQRALAKERKLQRPNAPKLHQAKLIWESLRQRNQSKADRQAQVDELFSVIKGDIPALVFGHSASRFVQAAIKYGTAEQRMAIAKELEGRYVELAKGKYGKFLVGKILENADVRNLVVKEFMGHIGRLISHKEAGMVVNDIYRDICTPAQKLEFLHEIYGPEFRLFQSDKGMTLKQILEQNPEKKETIAKNLVEMVKGCMKKDIINLDFVHTCLLQALEISTPKDIEELVSLFKEQIHQLAHTKDGAHAACLLIAYGTAKDRKAMIKCIREIIVQMATDPFGHMILIVLCAVVDDTKLVSKAVLNELKTSWHDLVRDRYGRKIVLFLCREDKDPLVKECREKSANTSKKDQTLRRQELLDAVSDDLLKIVAEEANELMRDPLGIQIAQEIVLSGRGHKSAALDAISKLADGDASQEDHIMRLPFTARVYKTLVQGGHYSPQLKKVEVVEPALNFDSKLLSHIKPHITKWATGEGSFVVVGLLESLKGTELEDLKKQLKKDQKLLKSKAGENKGTKIVLEKIS